MSMIAKDDTNTERSIRCDNEGHLIVISLAKYEIKWQSKADFDKGTY